MDPDIPAPPPEARLIRTSREAAGMTAAQAAQASGGAVSATYWRDVERGYGGRRGQRAPARASARTLAAMARVTGATARQLTDVQREDAARVLEEILRRESAAPSAAPVRRAAPDAATVAHASPAEAILADLMDRHGDDPVVVSLGTQFQEGKQARVVVNEILEWLDFLESKGIGEAGQPRNGTSAG